MSTRNGDARELIATFIWPYTGGTRAKKERATVWETAKETQMYRMDFWTLSERERVG